MANSAPNPNIPLEKIPLNILSYSIKPVNQTERITCLGNNTAVTRQSLFAVKIATTGVQ